MYYKIDYDYLDYAGYIKVSQAEWLHVDHYITPVEDDEDSNRSDRCLVCTSNGPVYLSNESITALEQAIIDHEPCLDKDTSYPIAIRYVGIDSPMTDAEYDAYEDNIFAICKFKATRKCNF